MIASSQMMNNILRKKEMFRCVYTNISSIRLSLFTAAINNTINILNTLICQIYRVYVVLCCVWSTNIKNHLIVTMNGKWCSVSRPRREASFWMNNKGIPVQNWFLFLLTTQFYISLSVWVYYINLVTWKSNDVWCI